MDAPQDREPPAGDLDIDQLRAERDALRHEVEVLARRRRRGPRLRGVVAGFLVAVYALTFVASGVGIWLHRNTLNADVWERRVVPMGKDPALQQALSAWATDQIMETVNTRELFQEALPEKAQVLAVPLSSAVRDFVKDRVDRFFASERFERLWSAAAIQAHEQAIRTLRDQRSAVTADSDKVTINLIPLLDAVLNEILGAAPGLVGSDRTIPTVSVEDLPDSARSRLADALGVSLSDDFGTITVYDGGKLSEAQSVVRLFDRLVVGTTLLTMVLLAAALGVSVRRRRTFLQLLGVTAVGCVVVRRLAFLMQSEVLDIIRDNTNRAAVRVVLLGLVAPLTNTAAVVLWFLAATALVVVVTGPYPWAVSLRKRAVELVAVVVAGAGRAGDEHTRAWVTAHLDALRLAGYGVGVVALWFADLSWLSLMAIAGAVVGWQVLLTRFRAVEPEGPPEPEGPGTGTPDSPAPGAAATQA
jgi:hypothetical protein